MKRLLPILLVLSINTAPCHAQFGGLGGLLKGTKAVNDAYKLLVLKVPTKDGEITMEHHTDIKEVLKKALNKDDIDLIPTGNGDPIIAAREQWNDGSNTLAIAPGEVVTYNRNYVSNDLLRKHGILVHEVRSSELSRGRGGPRCMSCPIVREDL